jgi:zinc D-Ala-D-Ala carboxypeptidase
MHYDPTPIRLSTHFTLEEAIRSDTADRLGIPNNPPSSVIITMRQTAMEMEMVRSVIGGQPIAISSWYRSLPLNRALRSSDNSQHVKGEAVDFRSTNFGTPLDICVAIITNKESIPFDQLILEHTWVHVSFAILSGKPRGQVLSLLSNRKYAKGLTNPKGVPYKIPNLNIVF